jgi:acyl-CoA reductase-like NAD-dependent aldehyde dehydrogenase
LGQFNPGDPQNPQTRLGSMVSRAHADKVRSFVTMAQGEGARVLAQAPRWDAPEGLDERAWVLPTLIDQVDNQMRIAQEEVFGPVLAILEASGLEDAIEQANRSEYGLAAAIWTADMRKAHLAQQELQVGFVWVNSVRAGHISTPFGGVKQSGFGRDKSLHAFDNVSSLKTTWYDYS